VLDPSRHAFQQGNSTSTIASVDDAGKNFKRQLKITNIQ